MSNFFGTFDKSAQAAGNSSTPTAGPLTPAASSSWAILANNGFGSYLSTAGFTQIFDVLSLGVGVSPLPTTSPVNLSWASQAGWTTNLLLFAGPSYTLVQPITSIQIASNVLTVQCVQNFIVGTQVAFSGTNVGALNGQVLTILSSTGTAFTAAFTDADYGPTADSGTATNFPYLQVASFNMFPSFSAPSVALPNPVRAGSTILVGVLSADLNAFYSMDSVSDGTNSYTIKLSGNTTSNTGHGFQHLAWAQNVAPGALTVSVGTTHSFSTLAAEMVVFELPGAPVLTSIALTPANPSVAAGLTQQFTATGTYSDGSTLDVTNSVTWDSSDTGKATIASGGLATTIATGTTTISGTSGSVSGNTTLTVSPAILVSISVSPSTASINSGGATEQYTATGHYSDGSTQDLTSTVAWISSAPPKATINSSGLATSGVFGTTQISASLSGIASNNATLTVGKFISLTGSFQLANTQPITNGSVSFAVREYHNSQHVKILSNGFPITAQLGSDGSFSIQLETFDSLVGVTPYAMVLYDADGNFLMNRFIWFSGTGPTTFNDVPAEQSGTAFPPQYSGSGFRLIEGGFGADAVNGKAIFRISQQAVTSSGVQIVPSDIVVQLDGSGNLVPKYLYLSSDLNPFTLYLVRVLNSDGVEILRQMYSLSQTAPDISNLDDLSASPTISSISYSTNPGVLFAEIPWKV